MDRAAALRAYSQETAGCTRCPLAAGRTHVVFGSGDPDADLMLVGEAPGFHEDRQGAPFAGQAGSLLDRLLASIGFDRFDVYTAYVLKCRPPGNREPLPEEISSCEPHLFRQIELVQPIVVASFGNFATRLLTGRPGGVTQEHGAGRVISAGGRRVTLFPLYHPAAALYTPAMLSQLEQDFARLPDVLARAGDAGERVAGETAPVLVGLGSSGGHDEEQPVQLGLF